jgi:hypothetical protein
MGRILRVVVPIFLILAVLVAWLLWPRQASVVRLGGTQPEIEQAISEARRRLPEFTEALRSAAEGDRFAIKGRFKTDAGAEFLWVKDPIPSPKGYIGLLDQKPIALAKKRGDLVLVKSEDVVDWMVRSGGKTIGGFTESALADRQKTRQ